MYLSSLLLLHLHLRRLTCFTLWPRRHSLSPHFSPASSPPPPRPAPINALWQELVLNKTFEVVDHAQVVDAKRSLSTMLRDFTQTNNTDLTTDQIDGLLQSGEAMDLLSRRYEEEVQKPMTSMIMNGSLVQMMLIQTQFLKKEVMVSMERVDTLIKANQVNMELMATVPAFMMASVVAMCGGAVYRLLFKRQSRRRVRDEAEQILADIEQILNLVAGSDEMSQDDDFALSPAHMNDNMNDRWSRRAPTWDSPAELGGEGFALEGGGGGRVSLSLGGGGGLWPGLGRGGRSDVAVGVGLGITVTHFGNLVLHIEVRLRGGGGK